MKKMFAILSSAVLLTSLTACSEAAEPTNHKSKVQEADYTTLDSSWECDYFKLGINSHWECSRSITDYSISATFDVDSEYFSSIRLNILKYDNYHKLSESELISNWEKKRNDMLTDDLFKDDLTIKEEYETFSVSESFVKNAQAYIFLSSTDDRFLNRIEFQGDGFYGTFKFYKKDKDIVMSMIDSIVFN